MKKLFLILILVLFLIALKPVKAVNVEHIIEEKLETEDEVGVIVLLNDDIEIKQDFSVLSEQPKKVLLEKKINNRKLMVKKQQDKVLSRLMLKEVKKGIRIKRGGEILSESEDYDFKLRYSYSVINGFSGNVTRKGLEKLKNDPNVKSISYNWPIEALLDGTVPQINANDVWNLSINGTNITGKGETICIVDTGIDYNHSSLGSGWGVKVLDGYDFVNDDTDPMDDNNHGTHVAGTAASENETYRGVAPDAKLIAIKVLDSSGSGSFADLNAGIDWCTNNASKYNISVISMSLGVDSYGNNSYCDSSYSSTADAINTAVGQGIIVVSAAGNDHYTNGITSPACIENATPVGAVDNNDVITYNRGSLLAILAPGVSVHASNLNGGFVSKSGTSMSTPHVAGAAALLFQFKKLENSTTLTPQQVEDIFNNTGTSIDDSGGSRLNFSRLDVLSAIQSLDTKAPIWFNNQTNNTAPKFNETIQFNITFNDTIGLSSYIFSWNDTGNWINKTNGTLTGTSQAVSLNETVTATRGKEIYWKFYANDTNNNWNFTDEFKFIVQNTAPTPTLLSPTDGQKFNYNNPTINYSCNDADNDACTFYTYINDTLNTTSTTNITTLTFDDGNYTLTVMAGDGYENSSNTTNISFRIDATNPSSSDFISNCSNKTKTGEDVYWAAVFTDTEPAQYWLMYSQNVAGGSWTNETSKGYTNGENMTTNITLTATRGQDINGSFFFNDSSGNLVQTGYIGCTINNTQPKYSGTPSINDTSLYLSDTINCSLVGATFSDADGGSEGTPEYRWFNQSQGSGNFVEISGETSSNLSLTNMKKGDKVKCGVRAYDGFDYDDNRSNSSAVTIANTAPTAPTTLTPTTGTYGGLINTVSISCSGSTDVDGDTVNYSIKTYYDNSWTDLELNGDGSYSWDISSVSTQTNVDIACNSTDGTNQSSDFNPAGTFTIDNTKPLYTNLTTNATNNTKTKKTVSLKVWNISDNLGSGQIWYGKYNGTYFNSTPIDWINGTDYTFNITINEPKNTDVNLTVYFNDSMGNLNQTDWIGFTVNNTAPYSNFSISIESPVTQSDDLNGTISNYADYDEDTWTLNETRWYINNTLNSSYDNLTNISRDNTTANEQWVFSARVYDGYDWSEWVNSSAVTINDITTPTIVKNYTSTGSVNVNTALTLYLNLTDDGSSIDNTTIKAEVEYNNVKTNYTMFLNSGAITAGAVSGWNKTYTPTSSGTYYVKYYFCDISNNCGNSSDRTVSFTATVQTVETTSSGGGGGGGGGGGAVSVVTTTNLEEKKDFATGFTTESAQGSEFSFKDSKGSKHTITITKVYDDRILLTINSTAITITLKIGETKEIDIDDDGIKDISVELVDIVYGKVKLIFKKLAEKVEEAVEEAEEIAEEEILEKKESEEEVEEVIPPPERKIRLEFFIIPIIIVILFIVVLILILKGRGKKKGKRKK